MALFSRRVKKELKEMNTRAFSSLRTTVDATRGGFAVAPTTGTLYNTAIDYEAVKKLYYNQNPALSNGAFFARAIIDGTADHIGLPQISMQDEVLDNMVNGWVKDRWQKQLWEMYRNAMRDTKCWVRLRKPFASPFTADDERDDITLEILDADRVVAYYNPFTQELERVEIAIDTYIEDEPFDPLNIPATGARAYGREHRIIEIITPEQFMYYDQTLGVLIDTNTIDNAWGFVPLVEVFNDYDSTLHGGSSDLEVPYPFFQAFHDLVTQTRSAHGYHADPKVKFKLDDVMTFLRNNFPESFTGDKFTGQVSWKGKDVYFMQSEEDVGFIEATLNTGDSVSLMEFIIDCICIAAEVTEAVLFRAKAANAGETDELFRFKAKITRKRNSFSEYIQVITKMALKVSTGQVTRLPAISWSALQQSDVAAEGQAMNQIITAAEVANRAGAISRSTYRSRIRPFFPSMKDDSTEQSQALQEQQQEQQQQIEYERQLANIKPPTLNGNNSGQNGVGRRSRISLPIDLVPRSPGN